jgi:hypothetical protein
VIDWEHSRRINESWKRIPLEDSTQNR